MKKAFFTSFFLLTAISFVFAQRETNNWYFGVTAGVHFTSGSPAALTNGQLNTLEGCSSISDPDGNLLFYTDGIRVWNRNHVIMTNGNGLFGDPSSTQSGIIVPKPGSTTRFYIFTVDMQAGLALFPGGDADGFYRGFRYSEVDMTLSGGLGAVVAGQKNILLRSSSTEGLTAVKHANGQDVWVIIKGINNNAYYAYLVTSAGVNATPVVSNLGPTIPTGGSGEGAIGYMKASPDGTKIAACHTFVLKRVIVSDFNASTGVLSNPINILVSPTASSTGPYGVEFSNCNEYLYVGESDDFASRIFRYDLNAANVPASVTTFATINGPRLGALQLALDGKIYVAYQGATHLQVIHDPRLPTATYQANYINLAGRTSQYGLPPFITSFFNNLDFSAVSNVTADTIICLGDTTLFSAQISSYDSIRWYFGDPASGPNNTSTLLNPKHFYASPGTYTATLYKYQCNTIDSLKKTIIVRPLPVFNIRDTSGCEGTPIVLDPGISGATYNWSTGQTSQTASFSSSGNFSLTVTQDQCSVTDQFNVSFTPVPAATITPGGPTTFCAPGSVVLSAPAGMDSYQWLSGGNPIGGQTNQTYTATSSGSYTVRVENNGCFNTSAAQVVTVNNSPTVSISPAGPIDICSGDNVVLSISPGGLSNIRWFRNGSVIGGQTSNTLTVTTAGSYYATAESSGCEGTSNTVVVDVAASAPASVSVSASSNSICTGTSVTFTASPVNGGATPSYQWQLNGTPVGSNSPTFTSSSLSNGDQVRVQMTSSSSCATGSPALSNTLTMTVSAAAPASVSIAASSTTICSGTSVTFTATPVNGGTSPIYQWLLNGNPVGSNSATFSSSSLSNGDQVRVQMTSDLACATGNPAMSNIVTMTVNSTAPVSVSIAASSNDICSGTSVTFTATPVNGGASPAYQWLINGNPVGSNSPSFTSSSLANGDQVSVQLTSSAPCATGSPALSNTIAMTVSTTSPAQVSITASQIDICQGESVTFNATPVNGGPGPVYQWQLNGNPVGSNSSTYSNTSLSNGDQLQVQMTSNSTCVTSNPALSNTITISVSTTQPVSVSISSSANPSCEGDNVTFTATPVNGGAQPTFQWSLNGNPVGSNSPTFSSSTIQTNDLVSVMLSSSSSCATGSPATSNTITMAVNPYPVLNLGPDQSHCQGTTVTLDAGVSADTYNWSTGENSSSIDVSTSNTYSLTITVNGCSASDDVLVSFDQFPPASFSLGRDTIICEGDVIVLRAGNQQGNTYLWQDGSTSNTLSVDDAGVYYVTVSNDCGSVADTIEVSLDPCIVCGVYVPTAFSPNGDGVNDFLYPLSNCEITEYRFLIYNRWNELLFESNIPGIGWDGNYKGSAQPLDTYIYSVSYFDVSEQKTFQQKGVFTLLR